ncbi:unnamed protein product [marine sediment metagenome]|uniref:Uncharacterized protein n=1 Tax=marine sediment metagenome TaxID=412755 RepID=X1AGY8_9ZZZZ
MSEDIVILEESEDGSITTIRMNRLDKKKEKNISITCLSTVVSFSGA